MLTPSEFEVGRTRLWNELVNLHDTWDEYRILVGESDESREMLRACADWFFGRTQRLFMREVILGLSRLTDSAETSGKKNLVIDYLLEDPDLDHSSTIFQELAAAVAAARDAAHPFKAHRHKYIAHLDHRMAVTPDDVILPGLSRDEVTAAITALERAYNVHNSMMNGAHAMFDLHPLGGAQAVLRILEHSDRWAKMKAIHNERASVSDGAA